MLVEIDQSRRERIAQLIHEPIAAQPAEIFVDADHANAQARGEVRSAAAVSGWLKQLHAPELQIAARFDRPTQAADRPGGPAERIIRPDILEPSSVEAQKIAEVAAGRSSKA